MTGDVGTRGQARSRSGAEPFVSSSETIATLRFNWNAAFRKAAVPAMIKHRWLSHLMHFEWWLGS